MTNRDNTVFQNNDKLNFTNKVRDYINYYLMKDWILQSGMNFITWYWWSWKTTFIKYILNELKNEDNDYLNWRTLIHIQFNPWNFQSTKNIYQNFFENFLDSLIKEKYDSSLKSYINTLLKLLNSSWNNLLKSISGVINKDLLSVDDIIKKIDISLSTTYKDFVILITIDEIDRVDKNDLINIWKVLNIIKMLIELQRKNKEVQDNIICLYAADSKQLASFRIWDNEEEKPFMNFYQYYNKFPNTRYDVYRESINDMKSYILNQLNGFNNFKYLKEELIKKCNNLQAELEELNQPIVIRNVINTFDNMERSLNMNIDDVALKLNKNIYKDVLAKKEISFYINSRFKSNYEYVFDYIYINSINEKNYFLMNNLDLLYEEIFWGGINQNDKKSKYIEDKIGEIINKNYRFRYRLDYFDEDDDVHAKNNIMKLLQTNYEVVRAIISKVVEPWLKIVIDAFEVDVTNSLCIQDLLKIGNIENIEKILFLSRMWNTFLTRNHFTEIHNILLNNRGYEIEEKIKFFENSIEIFKRYILDLKNHPWKEINNSDTWFIITVLTFFHMFIRDVKSEIFDEYWNWKQWKEKESTIIIDWIAGLIRFCDEQFQKWTKLRFFFIYFYLRLIRYWVYRYEEKNSFILENIFKTILLYYYRDNTDFNLINTELSTCARVFEHNEFKNEMKGVNNNLVKYISDFFTLVKCNWDEISEILNIIETVIYAIFYEEKVNRESEIREFIKTYIKNRKYKFLLICNSLVYNFGYEQKSEFRNTFKSLNDVYKIIYNELNLKWGIDELFEKYYDEIHIYYEDEKHQTKEGNLKELVDSKIIKWKEFAKKSILHILDNFYKNDTIL